MLQQEWRAPSNARQSTRVREQVQPTRKSGGHLPVLCRLRYCRLGHVFRKATKCSTGTAHPQIGAQTVSTAHCTTKPAIECQCACGTMQHRECRCVLHMRALWHADVARMNENAEKSSTI